MALLILSATSLIGVGYIGRDLTNTRPSAPIASSSPAVSLQAAQQPGKETPVINVTGAEPAEAVAVALGPAVVQIVTPDGLGSGVVYTKDGFVMTNAHVVGAAPSVKVIFSDGGQVDASVVGSDPSADIAVVKLDNTDHVSVAQLGTDPVKVGQTAIAVGSPFGLQQSVTAGIVSAVDRPVCDQASGGTCSSSRRSSIVINMIQTDAPINPGNSGGALANRNGMVIGINTAIFSQTGENNGIGFAIPIQTAKTIADKIVKGESLDKGYLGVNTKVPTAGGAGAQVVSVETGSPASKAGLKRNDVITSLDGQPVKSRDDMSARIAAHAPGDTVKIDYQRNGEAQSTSVTLTKR